MYKISCWSLSTSNNECSDHSPHLLEVSMSAKCSATAYTQKNCPGEHVRVLSATRERGAGKTHGWDANTLQPRAPGQIQDAFTSYSLKGMKTTQVLHTIKTPITTALLNQLSQAKRVLQKPLRFPITISFLSSTHKLY